MIRSAHVTYLKIIGYTLYKALPFTATTNCMIRLESVIESDGKLNLPIVFILNMSRCLLFLRLCCYHVIFMRLSSKISTQMRHCILFNCIFTLLEWGPGRK